MVALKVVVLALLLAATGSAHAGKILLYSPFMSKSMKITMTPLAEELAKRGHDVTLVVASGEKGDKKFKEIVVKSDFDKMSSELSSVALGDKGGLAIPPVGAMIDASIGANDNALSHPDLKKLLDDRKTKFDVVITSNFVANEAGYYLAHRFNASLAHYFTAQTALSWVDSAMGQPNNPAYMPMFLLPFTAPMTFLQRVINTVAVNALRYVGR
jgi:glucuronosyltransferase